MSLLVQFFIGLLFGSGLIVAGMSNPQKIQNFLDLAAIPNGGWDPSLLFVMGAGALVTLIGYRYILKRPRPIFDTQFHMPNAKHIDAPIIVGPAIFGLGWGLAGFCPGPALTALGMGSTQAILFVISMIAGMIGARLLAHRNIVATTPAIQAR